MRIQFFKFMLIVLLSQAHLSVAFATPLNEAVRRSDLLLIHQILLENPRRVNEPDSTGKLPIQVAIEQRNSWTIEILISSGASLESAREAAHDDPELLSLINNPDLLPSPRPLPTSQSRLKSVIDLCSGSKSCFASEEYETLNASPEELADPHLVSLALLEESQTQREIPLQGTPISSEQSEKRSRLIFAESVGRTGFWKGLCQYTSRLLSPYWASCGPISISLAYQLMGHSKRWPEFIMSFPYFKLGVFPDKLVSHLNSTREAEDPTLTQLKLDRFGEVLSTIRSEISSGRPVISLLVPGAITQHYVTIVGFNDNSGHVLLLDPNGSLKTASYDWLDRIMYAGIRKDLGIPYLLGSLAITPLMMWKTDYGYYNLFQFTPSVAPTREVTPAGASF